MKVLYVSGYTADVTVRYGTIEQEAALLQKPFAAEALTTKVRQILDEEC